MIDPITAFATAQAAVAGIKKAVQLGKDINGLIGEFGKFFDAKDVIQKAANDNAKSGKSDTAQAMEIVMQAQQLKEAEEQLKHMLVYGGYPELWDMMLVERSKIRQAREKKEREARAAQLKKAQERQMMALYILITLCFVTFIIGGVYILLKI